MSAHTTPEESPPKFEKTPFSKRGLSRTVQPPFAGIRELLIEGEEKSKEDPHRAIARRILSVHVELESIARELLQLAHTEKRKS